MTRNSLPQLLHGCRYGDKYSICSHNDGNYFAPQGCVIKSVNLVEGVIIHVPTQRYVKHLDLRANAEGTAEQIVGYRHRSGELKIIVKETTQIPGALVECSDELRMIGLKIFFDN